MAKASSSYLATYPNRFYAAASYVGFNGSSSSSYLTSVTSRFHKDVSVLLYGLYQQATIGPCNIPKPRGSSPEWTSWHAQGNLAAANAMRIFVKILEEEDPAWYSRVPEFLIELAKAEEKNAIDAKNPNMESLITQNGEKSMAQSNIAEENAMPAPQQNVTSVARSSEKDHEAGPEGMYTGSEFEEEETLSEGFIEQFEQLMAETLPENLPEGFIEQCEQFMAETLAEIEAEIAKEKEETEAKAKENLQCQLKQELVEAETRIVDITKELQSVLGQLASEQSRCFKLEVDVPELRQKLQTMEKELELLQRQKAASEQASCLRCKTLQRELELLQRQNAASEQASCLKCKTKAKVVLGSEVIRCQKNV